MTDDVTTARQLARVIVAAGAALAILLCSHAGAQVDVVRTYDVPYTDTPPTLDGTVDPGEWDSAPEAGDWRLLRESSTFDDFDDTSFRAMWDNEAFYLLLETGFGLWGLSPGPAPAVDFGNNNWNIYWDPNLDDDPNVPEDIDPQTTPAGDQDNYQIAFSSFEGSSLMQGEELAGNWFLSEARHESNFDNNTGWRSDLKSEEHVGDVDLREIVVAQSNGFSGGVAEVKVPWSEFDAPAELEIDDGMGGTTTVETGLNHPYAPSSGDTWFFQLGRISTDPTNFLPVWNWHPGQYFAEHPHGEITFVGAPEEGLEGDYNDNGRVEQADLDLVLLNWGQSVDGLPAGWINERPTEGIVDQAELDGVLLNWGSTAGGLVAAAVPEPHAGLLALAAVVAAASLVCRRDRGLPSR